MKATYVHVDTTPALPMLPYRAAFKPRWWGYIWFLIGAIVLTSSTIGFVFGLFLYFGDTKRQDRSQPGTLWMLCTFIGKAVIVLGIIGLALFALAYTIVT